MTSDIAPSSHSSLRGHAAAAHWLIALTALSIAATGHNFGVGNHTIYLAWIEHARNPLAMSRDWYLHTPVMHENIVGPLRWLGDQMGDANAFLLALFVSRLILLAAVWRLARGWGGEALAATLAAVLVVLAPRVSLGGHYPAGSYFEASHLGMALAAVALSCVARRQWLGAGVFLGLAAHTHIFVGAHAGAIAFLAALLDRRAPQSLARRLSALICPALLLGAYSMVHAAGGYLQSLEGGGLTGRQVVEVLAFRHPHHHSPRMWPLIPCLFFIAYAALGALLSARAGRGRSPLLWALYGYSTFAAFVGVVFVEWVPTGIVALLQFYRVTVLLMIWTAVEVALWLGKKGSGTFLPSRHNELPTQPSEAKRFLTPFFLALAAVGTFRIPAVFLPLAAVLLGVELCFRRTTESTMNAKCGEGLLQSRAGASLAAAASLAGFALLLAGAAGWLNPLAARLGRPEHFRLRAESPDPGQRALEDWIRDNLPPDAVVLHPPGWEGFHIYARRAEVASYKMMTFTRPAMREWFDRIVRLSDLGRFAPDLPRDEWEDPDAALARLHEVRLRIPRPWEALDEGYRLLEEEDVVELAKRYGADYFIASEERSYNLPKISAAGGYAVYQMP